jgi:hypothetical protein
VVLLDLVMERETNQQRNKEYDCDNRESRDKQYDLQDGRGTTCSIQPRTQEGPSED